MSTPATPSAAPATARAAAPAPVYIPELVQTVLREPQDGTSQTKYPFKDSWRMVRMWWGNNEPPFTTEARRASLERTNPRMPLPFVQFDTSREFLASHALTDWGVPDADPNRAGQTMEVLDSIDIMEAKAKRVLKERLHFNFLAPATSSIYAEEIIYSNEVSSSSADPQGIVTTSISQWVVIEIIRRATNDELPKMRVWGFLQPRGFDGETPLKPKPKAAPEAEAPDVAQAEESDNLVLSREDYPRCGWAEYEVDFAAETVVEITYVAGVAERALVVAANNWSMHAVVWNPTKDTIAHRLKLRVVVRNQVTAGDLIRKQTKIRKALDTINRLDPENPKTEADIKDPLSEIEAGCWLKVWVRNEDPDVLWPENPTDNEANTCQTTMDNYDQAFEPVKVDGKVFAASRQFPFRNHAWLRGRIVAGNSIGDVVPNGSSIVPLYVALVTPEGIESLSGLINYFTAPPPQTDVALYRKAASTALASIAAGIMFFGIKSYSKGKRKREIIKQDLQFDTDADRDAILVKRAKLIDGTIEFFAIPARLSAYALAGFSTWNPWEVLKKAESQKGAADLLTMIYRTVFDIALADSPARYAAVVKEAIAKRKSALAQYAGLKSDKPKSYLEHLKEYTGALAPIAWKDIEGEGFELSVPLANLSGTQKMPKPFGVPVLVMGVPVAFLSAVFSYNAAMNLELELAIKETELALKFGLSLPPDSKIEFGVDLCAIWSVLSDPLFAATNGDYGMSKARARRESNAIDADAAPTDADNANFEMMRYVKILQNCLDVDISMMMGMNGDGYVGACYSYDPIHHKTDFHFSGSAKQDLGLTLKAHVAVAIKLSLLSWTFKPLEVDILSLSPEKLDIPLAGKAFGREVDFGDVEPIYLAAKLDQDLSLVMPAGGPMMSNALCTNQLVWGEKKQVVLNIRSGVLRVSPVALNICYAKGVEEPSATGEYGPANATPIWVVDLKGIEVVTKKDTVIPEKLIGPVQLTCANLGGELMSKGGKADEIKGFVKSLLEHKLTPIKVSMDFMRSPRDLKELQLLKRPGLTEISLAVIPAEDKKKRQIKAQLNFQHFVDSTIWVRIRKPGMFADVLGSSSSFVEVNGQEWQSQVIENLMPAGDGLHQGTVSLAMKFWKIEAGEEYWVEFALIPDDAGVLNAKLAESKMLKYS